MANYRVKMRLKSLILVIFIKCLINSYEQERNINAKSNSKTIFTLGRRQNTTARNYRETLSI